MHVCGHICLYVLMCVCVCVLPQHQEKRGDIIASLGLLGEDVQAARALTPPGCVSALLQRLEHSLTNYQHILAHLELSVRTQCDSPPG